MYVCACVRACVHVSQESITTTHLSIFSSSVDGLASVVVSVCSGTVYEKKNLQPHQLIMAGNL